MRSDDHSTQTQRIITLQCQGRCRVLQQVPSAPSQPPRADLGRRMRAHTPLGPKPWERASRRPSSRRADVGARDRGVPTAGAGGAVRLRRAAQARQGRAGASPSCSLSESKWRQGEPGAVPEPKPLTGEGRAAAARGEWPRGPAPVRAAALGAAEATAAVPAAAAAGGASEVSVPRCRRLGSRLGVRAVRDVRLRKGPRLGVVATRQRPGRRGGRRGAGQPAV